MIYYYSATGNSKYTAETLARLLDEESVNILTNSVPVKEDTLFIVVSPVYSWGLPLPVVEWVNGLPEIKAEYCAIILTCGDDTGRAPEMLARLLQSKGLSIKGCWSVQMPNTYVILPGFDVDSLNVEERKIKASKGRIEEIKNAIKERKIITDVVSGTLATLKTSLIYPLFRRYGISPRKFHTVETCTGCGICRSRCVRGNISLDGGRPVWGKDCVSCLACYHYCPHRAVRYGKITEHKGQYHFPTSKELYI